MTKVLLIIAILIGSSLSQQPSDDYITLPDYPSNAKIRSGYLDLSNLQKKLHYLFIEKEKDAENAPIILWLNGGPGCSSLGGFSQEHGPALFISGTAQWKVNDYSFHKLANMIYLESPAGVGFSYNDSKDKKETDVLSAQENLEAILSFFSKYPNYLKNDFYIMGESYAGIYVPYLATNILKYNTSMGNIINLKGILVGNGVTDWNIDSDSAMIEFAFTHALYPLDIKEQYDYYCKGGVDIQICEKIQSTIFENINKVNIYNIYDICFPVKPTFESFLENKKINNYRYTPWVFNSLNLPKEKEQNDELTFLQEIEEIIHNENDLKYGQGPPCVDDVGFNTYYNRQDVKKAMKVRESICFSVCSEEVNNNYEADKEKGSFYLYPNLIKSGIKILIYSGDVDACIPFSGTQKWIKNLNLKIKEPWRSWNLGDPNNIGGFVTKYDGLTFITIRGAGHMVPQYKPKEAYYFLQKYLKNENY